MDLESRRDETPLQAEAAIIKGLKYLQLEAQLARLDGLAHAIGWAVRAYRITKKGNRVARQGPTAERTGGAWAGQDIAHDP